MRKSKLPMIFQSESVECGLAALAMILHYYGYHVSVASLRQRCLVDLSGMSLAELIAITKHYQLVSRVLRVEMHHLPFLRLPAILHWDLNHFVVLQCVKRSKIRIHDPGKGILTYSYQEFSNHFTGIVVECVPTIHFQPLQPQRHNPFIALLKSIPNVSIIGAKLCVFALIYQALLLLVPYYFKTVIDAVIPTQQLSLLIRITLAYLSLRCFIAITKVFKMFCLLKIDSDLNFTIGTTLLKQVMHLPLAYFEKRQLGDILYRFNSIEQLRQIITNGLIEGSWSVLLAIATLIMMFYLNATLAYVSVICSVVFVLSRFMVGKQQQRITAEMLTAKSQEQSCLIENIRGIQPIKLFSKEADRISLWTNRYVDFLQLSYKANLVKALFDNGKEWLAGMEYILVIFTAGMGMMKYQWSLGVVYSYLFYRQQFAESLSLFVDKLHDLKMLGIYQERLADIMQQPSLPPITNAKHPSQFLLTAVDLAFRYSETGPMLFSHLNLTIHEGECVVLTGPSGTGKSTLLKIMMGLLQPTFGRILLGGIPLPEISQLNRWMASVMQDDCLLHGTLAQNIAFFSTSPDRDKIRHCAVLANVDEEILAMPLKYNTIVGDMGLSLSGGQRQRILLARALYANPKMLFLDEATSHLDRANEQRVNEAIRSLGVTCIMIAHRPDTIRMADRIIPL